ncbi:MAG: phosphomannomutase/phosphoglucomutase [Gammaproteobacteria bacterium]
MNKPSLNLGGLGERVARVPLVALIAMALLALAAGGAWFLSDREADEGVAAGADPALNERYREMAQGLAAAIETAITPYAEATAAIAADSRVANALAADDAVTLAGLASELQPGLPQVLRLRLLPAATRDPRLDEHPPLTYASISMIRHAREGDGKPPMEIHLAGDTDEHMLFLRRVDDADGVPLGFVHLAVAPAVVRDAFATVALGGAHGEVRQGPRLRVVTNGPSPAADVPAISLPVRGTILSVAVQSAAATAAPSEGGMPVAVPAGIAVAVLLAVVVWLQRRPAVRVGTVRPSSDAVIYQGAIRAILDGAHPGLEQLLPRARSARQGAPPTVALDALARADDEDVTTFGGGIVVEGDEDPTIPRDGDIFDLDLGEMEAATTPTPVAALPVPGSIFRSYDIRGVVGETLTEDGVYQIGRALGAEAEARGQKTVVVARDGRHSSEDLLEALTKGLLESGREVLDIGLTPTPVLYFATHYLDARSGVMITGSHNPAEYNGLKIVLDGETLSGEAIQAVRRRVEEQDFVDGTGQLQSTDIIAEYIRRISEEIPVSLGKALRVVVDCGNGVPGMVAPDVLRAIGHDVVELFCDVDGDFPNHHPDPSQPANLAALIDAVADEGADIGLAFDGDGDRLGVVDSDGNIIWPDRQMILFARDILARNPGAKIIYDVKCSGRLPAEIEALGGEPVMSRSGHSLIKAKMQETGALLAGEMSGHIFFKERWYGFDDAIYAAARLLEIVVNSAQSAADLFAALPGGAATPELHLPMAEAEHAAFMQKVIDAADFPGARLTTLDGLRVDFDDSWGLVRPSNTTPCLVLRFEGDDEAALEGVKERFRSLLTTIDADLDLPF